MSTPTIVIETNSGPICGIVKTNILGDDYLSFQSIPYAYPPVGELRFRVIKVNKKVVSIALIIFHIQGPHTNKAMERAN